MTIGSQEKEATVFKEKERIKRDGSRMKDLRKDEMKVTIQGKKRKQVISNVRTVDMIIAL